MAMRPLNQLPSIRAKLGSVIVFAVAVTILIMYITIAFALRETEQRQQFLQLQAQVQTVAAVGFNSDLSATGALKRLVHKYRRPIDVVSPTGSQVTGLGFPGFPLPATAGRPLDGQADHGTAGNLEYYGYPIIRQGHVVGAVYMAHQIEGAGLLGDVKATLVFVKAVWWQLLLAGLISAIIALGLSRVLARGMTQPLRDMARAAQRLARGDYRQRVSAQSRDELGELARSFNRMAGELEGVERLRRDLVANVSHELRTPISALRAHLENLLDGVERPEPATLAVMLDQSERLGRLVEELLDLSRLESGGVKLELEPLPLAPLVRQVGREIALARPEGSAELVDLVDDRMPPVLADRERVHQVLYNLLDNAFRFTPHEGSVTVRARRTDGMCEVMVEDTGPGIPPEHMPFVFERFYRVDAARARDDGGTGIGLTIVRSVVEAHGGRIWIEQGAAGGAAFVFTLPLADVPGRDAGVPSPRAAVPGEARVKEGV